MHEALQKRTTWNNHLKGLNWRLDVKSASRDAAELNEPSAIFELSSEAGYKSGGASAAQEGTVRFEITREQLGGVLGQFKEIQAAMDAAAGR